MRRLLVLLVLALAVGACVEPLPEDATGEAVFQATCAGCHGPNLQGRTGPPLGEGAPSSDLSRDYFVDTITNGRGRMPSFEDVLTDEQIQRVVDYILSEQGR
jgi:mono/diheme cytochrome c family protein